MSSRYRRRWLTTLGEELARIDEVVGEGESEELSMLVADHRHRSINVEVGRHFC